LDIAIELKALILGLVEGATEFLPVSSTGHLIVAADFLGFRGEVAKTFEIAIQLGAILAVVWNYHDRLAGVVKGLATEPRARRFVANLLIAFLPAAVLGLAFNAWIKATLFNPVSVAVAFIVGGLVIILIEKRGPPPRVATIDEITWREALWVGVAQCFSLIPGTSRSGATIMGGLLAGLSRHAATEFSFFLAIPIMFAATAYSLYKARDLLSMADLPVFAIGFVAAFFSALAIVRFLLRFVARHSFIPFAWYRIVAGLLLLWYFHVNPWTGEVG
jgi:undecaprenyl-diphosphatase